MWEIYKPETKKIDAQELTSWMDALARYIPLVAMRENYYIVRGYIIASDMIAGEAEVERFYSNFPDDSELEMYQPTKADLNQYIKYSFDRRSPSYKKMRQLIAKQRLHMPFKNIMRYIETNTQLGQSLPDLTIDFKRTGMMQFQTLRDLQKFVTYYQELEDHTRQWWLRGHTPVEVLKMRELR